MIVAHVNLVLNLAVIDLSGYHSPAPKQSSFVLLLCLALFVLKMIFRELRLKEWVLSEDEAVTEAVLRF